MNDLWKGKPEDTVGFFSGVTLHWEVGNAAAVAFDEGELGHHLL